MSIKRGDIMYYVGKNGKSMPVIVVTSNSIVNGDYVSVVPVVSKDNNPMDTHCEVITKLP